MLKCTVKYITVQYLHRSNSPTGVYTIFTAMLISKLKVVLTFLGRFHTSLEDELFKSEFFNFSFCNILIFSFYSGCN